MSIFFRFLLVFVLPFTAFAQITPTTPADRMATGEQRAQLRAHSLAANLPFTNIGPSVFGGRITDIAVNPNDPTHFYVAYASGGLWETKSNGTHFEPLFDDQIVMTIGDIAVNWKNGRIWVGTGENNSSRSSYAGTGLFFSDDNGKTWQHSGLSNSHHIGRIVLNPQNPDLIYVASLGPLYSKGGERGIYTSRDGGVSWETSLSVNENTGFIDLVIDPTDEQTLYAAAWERHRSAWNFQESGSGSGIYKTTDGGASWALVSGGTSNFPKGEGTGRIGLSATKSATGTTVLYATLDNYNRRPADESKKDDELTKAFFKTATADQVLSLPEEKLSAFLTENNFPKGVTASTVQAQIKDETLQPAALAEYLETANSLLFDTEVVGAELYRSLDGGKTWQKTHDDYLDDLYYSYGYYFAQVRAQPYFPDEVYLLGVPIIKSKDGGKTFEGIQGASVHADHHALWLNPNRKGHLIVGNDGGINISYDGGKTYIKCNTPAVGQFYSVAVDNQEPYNVFGGLQDNGVWVGASDYKPSVEWHAEGEYPYRRIMGGDGMQVQIDPRNPSIVYTGYQFGNYYRLNLKNDQQDYITPKHELGERPYRWNWQAPILISRHQPDILYFGSNFLHRSFDQGKTWQKISGDLTTGGKKGDVPFGTLTTIDESPTAFGVLYAGTDDGMIHGTRDGGVTWQRLDTDLPQGLWVSRIIASAHKESRVYATLNGYRNDHFESYVYRSDDFGATWERLGLDLPAEPVNVLREDPTNADLLYVGTDHGLYFTLDGGQSFAVLGDLPAVAIHDLAIQPTAQELVVGTHGRSFYKAPLGLLYQLNDSIQEQQLHLFAVDSLKFSKNWGKSWSKWFEQQGPSIALEVFTQTSQTATLQVLDSKKKVVFEEKRSLSKGLQKIEYNLTAPLRKDSEPAQDGQIYLTPENYRIRITGPNQTVERMLVVEE